MCNLDSIKCEVWVLFFMRQLFQHVDDNPCYLLVIGFNEGTQLSLSRIQFPLLFLDHILSHVVLL